MQGTSVRRLAVLAWVTASALGWVAGCDGCRPKPKFDSDEPKSSASSPEPKIGKLTGSVKLAPGYELPKYLAADMERRVLQHIQGGALPEACTPPKLSDRTPVLQGPDGKLIGVMVAASEFSQKITRPMKVHDLVIKDCRLTPRLVVGQVGDMLNLKSEVQFPFMPTYGPNAYNETLVAGQSKAIRMDKPGVDNVLCGFTAPCGRADIVVLHHPIYAVTDDNGRFEIDEFPSDETVRVNAWHPLFKDVSLSVKVGRGETKDVEFVITPLPQAQEAPAATPTPAPTPAPANKTGKTPAKP